jgi:cell division protein FtsI (penicillin-binding protein 3)
VLHRFGFGENTGVGFPGEQGGVLEQKPPGSFPLATLSFGYGLSVTVMQLARAYSVLANDGIKAPVSLLKVDNPLSGERIIDGKIARQLLVLLEAVFAKSGTAEKIKIPGYHVAGKTGTAWKAAGGGYQKNRYRSSFVGIAPLSNPRLVVVVMIDDPQGKNFLGGLVSGPVFQGIMEGTLRILDVPPDAISE